MAFTAQPDSVHYKVALACAISSGQRPQQLVLLRDAAAQDDADPCALITAARRRLSAEVLIAGEGGPADPKRALSLLKAHSDTARAKGVLGQAYLEARLVRRDVQAAVRLIDIARGWDLDLRLQVLAENPDARVNDPKGVIYHESSGRGTRRARRPDCAQTLRKCPVPRSARSL